MLFYLVTVLKNRGDFIKNIIIQLVNFVNSAIHVDDFVCCFEYKRDEERLDRNLGHRMKKFGLELAAEKTRMLQCGRFARSNALEHGYKLQTFAFLGFKHVCGVDKL